MSHTNQYEIIQDLWHQCKLCQTNISTLVEKYGGAGIYKIDCFQKHVQETHNLSLTEYFTKFSDRPLCKCGACGKTSTVSKRGSKIWWREYVCGRNEGQQKWSKWAKEGRKGKNNPMYGLEPWNKDLSKENHPSLMNISQKLSNRTISDTAKQKMSESAKKRIIHGHSNCPHSIETKEKLRQTTLNAIKRGAFKQTKTKPHLAFALILKELNLLFEEEKIYEAWCFDFYLTKYNIYIEVDGDYFHSNPILYPNGPKTKTQKINYYRDYKKNEFCKINNVILLRFWESDILNKKEEIKCKLRELLQLNMLEKDGV